MNTSALSLTVSRFVAAAISVVVLRAPRSVTAMVARNDPALPARRGPAARRPPSSAHCHGMIPAAEAEQPGSTPATGAAFLQANLAARVRAEQALHGGDIAPRRATRSHDDPVTLFGAGVHYGRGWRDVGAVVNNRLRATHVHPREPQGEKIVHRHGKPVPSGASVVAVVLSAQPGRR